LPTEFSVWQRFDVVDRARAQFKVPVTHVVAKSVMANQVPR
jgi:GABA permease